MRILVAVCGAKLSGKSEFADRLAGCHGFEVLSFAEPIRAALRAMGVPEEYLRRDADKTRQIPELGGVSFRKAAQTLGTQWGRETIGADLWAMNLFRRIPARGFFVVDDLRMKNEAEIIRRLGGQIVRVNGGRSGEFDSHATEQEFQEIVPDCTIENAGTLADYRLEIDRFVSGLVRAELGELLDRLGA
jgi:hypothetical protein